MTPARQARLQAYPRGEAALLPGKVLQLESTKQSASTADLKILVMPTRSIAALPHARSPSAWPLPACARSAALATVN
jgi:hypothetical protein